MNADAHQRGTKDDTLLVPGSRIGDFAPQTGLSMGSGVPGPSRSTKPPIDLEALPFLGSMNDWTLRLSAASGRTPAERTMALQLALLEDGGIGKTLRKFMNEKIALVPSKMELILSPKGTAEDLKALKREIYRTQNEVEPVYFC